MTLAKKLAKLRQDAGIDPRDAARFVGVHYTTYWRWERGDSEPSFKFRIRLAQLYDVPLSSLQDDATTEAVA